MSGFVSSAKRLKELVFVEKCRLLDYPRLKKSFDFDVLGNDETVNRIVNERLSVSRFGDGEFALMRNHGIGFQAADERLSERLKEVLNTDVPGLLVCITDIMLRNDGYLKQTTRYHATYVVNNYVHLKKTIPQGRLYGCANFTRFYADYQNKDRALMKNRIESIRSIWGGTTSSLSRASLPAVGWETIFTITLKACGGLFALQ